MDRESLVNVAIGVNESYRTEGEHARDLELGFLCGTAEMITALTLQPNESYHDVRSGSTPKPPRRPIRSSTDGHQGGEGQPLPLGVLMIDLMRATDAEFQEFLKGLEAIPADERELLAETHAFPLAERLDPNDTED